MYKEQLLQFLSELFREDWMDDSDWDEFLVFIEHVGGVSLDKMENDIEIGVKNGYSVEKQFDLLSKLLKK